MTNQLRQGTAAVDRIFHGNNRVLDAYMGTSHVVDQSPVSILTEAVWYIDATDASASGQTITNLGTGGSALNATAGSTGSADSNDPKYLAHTGTNYVYLPGGGGGYANSLSVPDSNELDVTGDIDIRAKVAFDDWTPAGLEHAICAKTGSGQRSWIFSLEGSATPKLNYYWTADGSTNRIIQSSAAVSGVADGADKWLRVTHETGSGNVKFYTSDDGSSWSQLGTTQSTTAGTRHAGTANVTIGDTFTTGKFYRVQVLSGVGGSAVLDVDTSVITSGSATSFTATTGQTVSINRSTSGRKSVAVVGGPCWLFGTDDYLEVPDNDLLDFGATDSMTVMTVGRAWDTLSTNIARLAKKPDTTAATQGWALTSGSSTAAQGQLQAGDGTNGTTAVSGSRSSGGLSVLHGVRHVTTDYLTMYLNGTAGTPVTDATTGTLANSEVMRVGRLSGAGTGYANAEIFAAAVWRRPLTDNEISLLTDYFETRCP